MPPHTKEVQFLIVDDDKISVMAMQRAMKRLKILNPTNICSDGQEALEFLREATQRHDGLPPIIVTLDLNMPRMGGIEFLEAIRADPTLSKVIVFVFTTSDMPNDVQHAYDHNVAGYVVKDNPSETFSKALEMLGSYSRIVEVPV